MVEQSPQLASLGSVNQADAEQLLKDYLADFSIRSHTEFTQEVAYYRQLINSSRHPDNPHLQLSSTDQQIYGTVLDLVVAGLVGKFNETSADKLATKLLEKLQSVASLDGLTEAIARYSNDYLNDPIKLEAMKIAARQRQRQLSRVEATKIGKDYSVGIYSGLKEIARGLRQPSGSYNLAELKSKAQDLIPDFVQRGWQGVKEDPDILYKLFTLALAVEELLEYYRKNLDNVTQKNLDDLEKNQFTALKDYVKKNVGLAGESENFVAQFSERLIALRTRWNATINSETFANHAKGKVDAGSYKTFICNLQDLEARLDDLRDQDGVLMSFGSLTENQLKGINNLANNLQDAEVFFLKSRSRVPKDDKNRLQLFYDRLMNEVKIIQGIATEADERVFTKRVSWWLVEHGLLNDVDEIQVMWDLYKVGQKAVFKDDMAYMGTLLEKLQRILVQVKTMDGAVGDVNSIDYDYHRKVSAVMILMNRLQEMIDGVGSVDGAGAVDDKAENASDNEIPRNVLLILEKLKKYNPSLHTLEQLSPEESTSFIFELNNAIFSLYLNQLAGAISGGGGFPMPAKATDLFQGDLIDFGSRETSSSLEYFIDNFPWYLLSKKLQELKSSSEDEFNRFYKKVKDEIIDKFKNRLTCLQSMQDRTIRFGEINNDALKRMSHLRDPIQTLEKMQNGFGYQTWDLSASHDRSWEHEDSEVQLILKSIFCDQQTGEEDWPLMELTNFFMHHIEATFYTKNCPYPTSVVTSAAPKLERIKRESIQKLDSKFVNRHQPVIEVAWFLANWNEMHTLKYYLADIKAAFAKFSRALNARGYNYDLVPNGSKKSADKVPVTFSQLVRRGVLTVDEFFHVFARKEAFEPVSASYFEKYALNNRLNEPNVFRLLQEIDKNCSNDGLDIAGNRGKYVFLRPKENYLGVESGFLAIRRAYWEDEHDSIPINFQQFRDSLLDSKYIDWNSLPANPLIKYCSFATLIMNLYEYFGADIRNHQGFADIHRLEEHWKPRLQQVLIREISQSIASINFDSSQFRFTPELAETIDRQLRKSVFIREIPESWLSVGEFGEEKKTGPNFEAMIKIIAHYGIGELINAGPVRGEEAIELIEPLSFMFGAINHEALERGFGEIFKDFSDKGVLDLDQWRRFSNTKLGSGFDRIITHYLDHLGSDRDNENERKKAKNQIIVEMYMIGVWLYLDGYAPLPFLEGKKTKLTSNVKDDYGGLETYSRKKPMHFAARELMIKAFEAQMLWFIDRLVPPPLHIYNKQAIITMMRSLGIIGTPEQVIADRYYYEEVSKPRSIGEKKE